MNSENNALVPAQEPVLVTVDQSQLMHLVEQHTHYRTSISQVIAALPVLAAELPNVKWMSLISQLDMNPMSLFSKKKKAVSPEKLQSVFDQLIKDHPHLQEPITHLVQFWITYKDINHGIIAQQQP